MSLVVICELVQPPSSKGSSQIQQQHCPEKWDQADPFKATEEWQGFVEVRNDWICEVVLSCVDEREYSIDHIEMVAVVETSPSRVLVEHQLFGCSVEVIKCSSLGFKLITFALSRSLFHIYNVEVWNSTFSQNLKNITCLLSAQFDLHSMEIKVELKRLRSNWGD